MGTSRTLVKQVIAAYAGALYEAAAADGAVDAVASDLNQAAFHIRGHADLREALLGSALPAASRGEIARQVFASLHPAVAAVLGVMAERGECDLLAGVTESYAAVAEEKRGIVAVDVTTAVELTDTLRKAIADKFAADFGREVVLREKIDPSIVGGVIMSARGRKIDASIASQLDAARATLSIAHTGGDV